MAVETLAEASGGDTGGGGEEGDTGCVVDGEARRTSATTLTNRATAAGGLGKPRRRCVSRSWVDGRLLGLDVWICELISSTDLKEDNSILVNYLQRK
ncbi:unnamed protein product [Cuscuta campestris]|uniref:Uncharacterized protein n=1 Tax=Cuscuta campestris TaxID=132261 RepID=A0A484KEN5_9ASTE|nr:unnamed protein product [Cuscuta campestris]